MAYIFGSIWDRFNRNALNALSKSVEYQGKSIQDLVAKGQLTPEQYALLVSIVNGNISKGEVSVFDIDLNKGKIGQEFLSPDLLKKMTGETPVLSEVADGVITTKKVTDRAIIPKKTDFAEYVILSNNLENPNTRLLKHTVNGNTGEIIANANNDLTDYIEVKSNQLYSHAYSVMTFEYDGNFNFIRGSSAGIPNVTTSNRTKYVRYAIPVGATLSFRVNEGTLKPHDDFKFANRIKNQLIDLDDAKSALLENGTLKKVFKSSAENLDFLTRESPNLFNKDNATPGYRIAYNTISADANSAISGFIEVQPNTSYSVTEGSFTNFYDENRNFISGHGVGINTFTTPANTRYIRITVRIIKFPVFMLVKGATVPTESNYVPYNRYVSSIEIANNSSGGDGGTKRFEGQSLAFNGDSIVQNGGHLVAGLRNALGFSNAVNYGIGGTAYAVRPAPWDKNAISLRYKDMDDNHDVICMMAGTNDFSNASVTLGSMSDRGTNTFYGALHVTFSGLVNKFPTKKIAVFTMPSRYNQHSAVAGETVFDYADAIMEVASYYSIPSFDLLRHSQLRFFNEDNKMRYSRNNDGLHPNEDGYDLMLPAMVDFLKTI